MLVARLELHNANTGKVTELGRVIIANDETATAPGMGNYDVRGGVSPAAPLDDTQGNQRVWKYPRRIGRVENHPRVREPWDLVAKALLALGYGKGD